jgi:hypothetical protein
MTEHGTRSRYACSQETSRYRHPALGGRRSARSARRTATGPVTVTDIVAEGAGMVSIQAACSVHAAVDLMELRAIETRHSLEEIAPV